MAVPLPYLFITVKANYFEKISLSDMQIPMSISYTLTAHGKYPLLNADNLRQPI